MVLKQMSASVCVLEVHNDQEGSGTKAPSSPSPSSTAAATAPITIKGGVFITIANHQESFYRYMQRGFRITRANVTICDYCHYVEGELEQGAPYHGFIRSEFAAHLTVKDAIITPRFKYFTDSKVPGKKVAMAHFKYINPLPKNTAAVLKKYKKVVVAEQNMGQLAGWLRMKVDGFVPYQFNEVKGQPFMVADLVENFTAVYNK